MKRLITFLIFLFIFLNVLLYFNGMTGNVVFNGNVVLNGCKKMMDRNVCLREMMDNGDVIVDIDGVRETIECNSAVAYGNYYMQTINYDYDHHSVDFYISDKMFVPKDVKCGREIKEIVKPIIKEKIKVNQNWFDWFKKIFL